MFNGCHYALSLPNDNMEGMLIKFLSNIKLAVIADILDRLERIRVQKHLKNLKLRK